MPGQSAQLLVWKPQSWITSLAPGAMPSPGSCTSGVAKLSPATVPATCEPWFWVSHSVPVMPPAHSLPQRKSTASTLRWVASMTVPPLHSLRGGRRRAGSRK